MDFRTDVTGLYARILALISLALGLADAARLLGLGSGTLSPILLIGPSGFILLSALSIMRLFAAVGLWIKVRWGGLLLAGSLLIEIGLFLAGSAAIALTLWGFIFKLAVMLATIGLLGFMRFFARDHASD